MNINCFLGANSSDGFYSLYDGFCCADGDFLHLIKAGPGGGKSSFMLRIEQAAQEHGFDTVSVLCSGDPNSLDALYIPQKQIGFVDATSPHVVEPLVFAYNCDYVNLGRFCAPVNDENIVRFTKQYRSMYTAAYAYLSAAGELERMVPPGLIDADILEKVRKRAHGTAAREFGAPKRTGGERKCFFRCISWRGELVLSKDIKKLCKRIYILDDKCGLAEEYLAELLKEARRKSESIIIAPSPLCPEKLDGLIFPERELGYFSESAAGDSLSARHIRLDAVVPDECMREYRKPLREKRRLVKELTSQAVSWLESAKQLHDKLEAEYNPYVDFAALEEYTQHVIADLFG